jgi:hypothetical protein
MPTKEELEKENAELKELVEELQLREKADESGDPWVGRLPSAKENRARVQKRLGYERSATPAIVSEAEASEAEADDLAEAEVEKDTKKQEKDSSKLKFS